MRASIGVAIATGTLALASAGVSAAQDSPAQDDEAAPGYIRAPLRAPRSAFELGVGMGYSQGLGNVSAGKPIRDVGAGSVAASATLGYRASPAIGVGLNGSYQQFRAAGELTQGTMVRGMTAGAEASFHAAPFERVDPVLTLGSGYRLLWTAPPGRNNNLLTHGFELAKAQLGLDIRLSDSVAVGPSIGGSLDMFMWENPEGPEGNVKIANRRLSGYVFAGLQGRFDIGGHRQEKIIQVGSR